MFFYFVQHGVAVAEKIDPRRPLSADGRRDVEIISTYLQKADVTVRKVCHSGKTRAKETALVFAERIGGGNICELSGMNPADDAVEFAETLGEGDIMYVGHLPHMKKLVSYLITGDEDADVVKFVNGGVVCLEKDDSGYHIKWYLQPSMCVV